MLNIVGLRQKVGNIRLATSQREFISISQIPTTFLYLVFIDPKILTVLHIRIYPTCFTKIDVDRKNIFLLFNV